MKLITLKYRIKDSISRKKLIKMGYSINFVWNYCNETSFKYFSHKRVLLSGYELQKLTSGCSNELGLNSTSVQLTCEEYAIRQKQFKKNKLNWRKDNKSLGWIPFKSHGVQYISKGLIRYNKKYFKFWESQPIGKIKCGSFNQDVKGNWYINLVCEVEEKELHKTGKEVGVDLGLKNTATYSDGTSFKGIKAYKNLESKLGKVQRAKKKKQINNIYLKIANQRKDSIHKETTRLVREFDTIVVGDVSSKKLVKTKMAKSTFDNSWGAYKTYLEYKTIRFGKVMKVVNESWTSKTCYVCNNIADFGGLSGLSIREWVCSKCLTVHDRDVNAAKNILRIGHDTPIKGILSNGGCQVLLMCIAKQNQNTNL